MEKNQHEEKAGELFLLIKKEITFTYAKLSYITFSCL
jgi:hypothetical protein